jgi:hypothetical protein
MRSLKDPVQGRLRRQPRLQPVDVERGHQDVARLTIGEIEDVVQQLLLRARDHPGALRLVDERAQFRCRADALARHYVPDLERRAKEDARGSLQDPHRRPQGHRATEIISIGRATNAASVSARSSVNAFGISSPSTIGR